MIRPSSRQRPGFTLIELIVVVAIIAVLIALLLPGVQKVREAASRTQCAHNLKEIGLALQNYQMRNQHFPAGFYQAGLYSHTGWQLQLLPYLEQSTMWNQSVAYLQAQPNNTDSNSFPAVNYQMSVFVCPSNIRPPTTNYTPLGVNFEISSYQGCTGSLASNGSQGTPNGLLYFNNGSTTPVTIDQITDGQSRTIAVGERPVSPDLYYGWGFAPWGSGYGDGDTVIGSNDAYLAVNTGDLATNIGLQPPSQPYATSGDVDVAHFWSYHANGAYFVMCDASVQFLPYSANNVFSQLCTIAGGEIFTMPF